jgi:hypothetical protein
MRSSLVWTRSSRESGLDLAESGLELGYSVDEI